MEILYCKIARIKRIIEAQGKKKNVKVEVFKNKRKKLKKKYLKKKRF